MQDLRLESGSLPHLVPPVASTLTRLTSLVLKHGWEAPVGVPPWLTRLQGKRAGAGAG